MQNTVNELVTNSEDAFKELLDELVSQVTDNVPDEAAEEYADEQGYEEEDEDAEAATVDSGDVRSLLIFAYNAGRDAALTALTEAVDEVK